MKYQVTLNREMSGSIYYNYLISHVINLATCDIWEHFQNKRYLFWGRGYNLCLYICAHRSFVDTILSSYIFKCLLLGVFRFRLTSHLMDEKIQGHIKALKFIMIKL